MKRKFHISASAVLGVLAGVRELYGEVPGTGQSLMDLMRCGWGYLDVHHYFPWTAVNLVLLLGAGIWMFSQRKAANEN